MLPPDVQEAMVAAIRQAEACTSGEIRIFVERRCAYMDAMDRAIEVFASLSMEQTEERNAVLVYVAVADKQFAIYGDEEIYRKAGGPHFWEGSAALLRAGLSSGDLAGGLVTCIQAIGMALAIHFPYKADIDKNELPDEIVFGK